MKTREPKAHVRSAPWSHPESNPIAVYVTENRPMGAFDVSVMIGNLSDRRAANDLGNWLVALLQEKLGAGAKPAALLSRWFGLLFPRACFDPTPTITRGRGATETPGRPAARSRPSLTAAKP